MGVDDGLADGWWRAYIRRCMRGTALLARNCDVLVATYSFKAGVSIDCHFRVAFTSLYTWVPDHAAAPPGFGENGI